MMKRTAMVSGKDWSAGRKSDKRLRFYLVGVLVAIGGTGVVGGASCVAVAGKISPGHFQYADVVLSQSVGNGEHYWVACLRDRITDGDTSTTYVCSVGVEVPHRSSRGPISDSDAQDIAAKRANEAAREVLKRVDPSMPISVACSDLRDEFRYRLRLDIPEATVKETCHPLAKPTLF